MKHKINFAFDYVFPTFILPNATMTELGIINYMTSMHSIKAQNATAFEQYISLDDVFDGQLGSMPNSGTGYFYQARVYDNVIDYTENALYLMQRNPNGFIYPIKPNASLGEFIGITSTSRLKRMEGVHFWKFISKKAMESILHGRCKIFIDYSMEPFVDKATYVDIHTSLNRSGIPNGSIIMGINSFNAKELYESYFTENERKLAVRNLPFCLDHSSWHYNDSIQKNQRLCMNESDFYNTKDKIRDNHFLMKIRNAREHRLAVLYKMVSDDLLKYGDWSFLSPAGYNIVSVGHIIERYNLQNLHLGRVKTMYDTAPHSLQSEKNTDYNKVNAWTDNQFKPHIDSYFEICFETFIHTDCKSLTEKIFKPLINFQPFIFVAFPEALKLLKSLGFKTFEGFIDESYDNETDNTIRIELINKEIDRLCKMSKEEIHNWYWSMEDILVHNHKTLLNYNKTKIFGEELISEFSNFIYGKII